MNLGYSHPVEVEAVDGVDFKLDGTNLKLSLKVSIKKKLEQLLLTSDHGENLNHTKVKESSTLMKL